MPRQALVMGVLNVTPDSFSDGNRFATLDKALVHAETLVNQGADIIDVGGESTRPGAEAVSVEVELARTLPVIEAMAQRFSVKISIDTSKYEVARAAVDAGAVIINDVTACEDSRMISLMGQKQLTLILMHMRGSPRTMQTHPVYPGGVVNEVESFLSERVKHLVESGVSRGSIWVDPGIGFGKTVSDNLKLLNHIDVFCGLSDCVVVGTSRKSFLGKLVGNGDVAFSDREAGTIASNLWAYQKGASVFRVHDVGQMKRALLTWQAIETCEEGFRP